MLRFLLVTAVAVALPACVAPSGPLPPAPDTCTSPSNGPVGALVLGAGNPADLSGSGMSPLQTLHDGDGVQLIHGGQGATMLGFVYSVSSVSGGSAPSCLAQDLAITDTAGNAVTMSTASLTTYAQPDGTSQTRPLWLPAAYPNDFVVAASAGGQSITLHLHLL